MKVPLCILTVGFILGASIWLGSPMITGTHEPWDSSGAYFYVMLMASGVILALPSRRWFWTGLIGLYLGQLLVMIVRPQGGQMSAPWWVGIMMLALFWLIAVGAAFVAVSVSWLLAHRAAPNKLKP